MPGCGGTTVAGDGLRMVCNGLVLERELGEQRQLKEKERAAGKKDQRVGGTEEERSHL